MLLIDLPEQREVDSSKATELSAPAEPTAIADDDTKTEGQDREAEAAERAEAEAAEEAEAEAAERAEEAEEAAQEKAEQSEEKAEQRPPRIVKRWTLNVVG